MTVTEYAELPDAEQKTAANVQEMVSSHELNTVLQGAVNAAFDSGTADPVAFMGSYLLERLDTPPQFQKLATHRVWTPSGKPNLEVQVFCTVNGVSKALGFATLPDLNQFYLASEKVEGEEAPEGDEAAPAGSDLPPLEELEASVAAVSAQLAAAALDPRALSELDAVLAADSNLAVPVSLTVSAALAHAGAAVAAMQEFTNVHPYMHVGRMSSVPDSAPSAIPGLVVPTLIGSDIKACLICRQGGSDWQSSVAKIAKVHEALKPLAEEKGCTFDAASGTFSAPEPPPPDPKSKEPVAATDPLIEALGLLEAAVEAAGMTCGMEPSKISLSLSVCASTKAFLKTPEAPEATEEEPEPVAPPPYWVYTVCGPCEGDDGGMEASALIEYYNQLCSDHPGLVILEDPLAKEDKNGWASLVEFVSESETLNGKLVLAGDVLYNDDVEVVEAAGLQASQEGIDWASGVVMHPAKLTVARAASLAQTVHKWKGHVIWDQLAGDSSAVSADIAVGLGAEYLEIGLPTADNIPKHNRMCEIERMLK